MMHARVVELFKFKEWLKEKLGIKDSSINNYCVVLKRFFIHAKDLNDIEEYNWFLANYSRKMRCTHYYYALRNFIKFKFDNNRNKRDQFLENLLRPKPHKGIKIERRFLNDEQCMIIINEISLFKHKIISMIQFLAGWRVHDILSIKRENVYMDEYEKKRTLKIIGLGKRDKRIVAHIFDPVAIDIINSYIDEFDSMKKKIINDHYEDYLFITLGTKGRPGQVDSLFYMEHMNYMRYWRDLKISIEKTGVIEKKFFSTHDFRRCFARKVWDKYKDVQALQRALNHENEKSPLTYLKHSGLQNIDILKDLQES